MWRNSKACRPVMPSYSCPLSILAGCILPLFPHSYPSLHYIFSPSVFPLPLPIITPPVSHSVSLTVSSASEFRRPVQEWVINSKLIWPLMIGSGTHSSVSDWPRDEEANFPWCSWRIVVALNYHLLCVSLYVCVHHKCVQVQALSLHACARVSS